jgi:hypothetical protein
MKSTTELVKQNSETAIEALAKYLECEPDDLREKKYDHYGLEGFVEEAVSADGRGHFLSSYDGEENEQDGFYIYRIN